MAGEEGSAPVDGRVAAKPARRTNPVAIFEKSNEPKIFHFVCITQSKGEKEPKERE